MFAEEASHSPGRTKPEQDLYSVLKPIALLCQITGIFPLSLSGRAGERKYSTSYISIIYNVTTLAISIIGLFKWTTQIHETIQGEWDHAVSMASIYLEFVLQTLSMFVMIVPAIIRRNEFANAIDTLSSQDTILRQLGTQIDYAADLKRTYVNLGISISGMIVIFTYQFIYELDFNMRYPLLWAAWLVPNIFRIISTCLFSDVLFALRRRFAALNKHLNDMIEERKHLSPKTISTRDCSSDRLRSIAVVHGAMCEVALNVDKIYALNIIVGVVCALKGVTTSMYRITRGIEDRNDINFMQMGGFFNRSVIVSVHIIYLITACRLAQNQASFAGKLVHKFEIIEGATSFNTMLRSFSLQLYHENIEFNAAGVLSLDATLLQSILGAVTTFLIIVIQLDTSSLRK